MIYRIVISLLIITSISKGYNQTVKNESFELELKIENLGRDYVGCGFEKYTICNSAFVKSSHQKIILGEEVLLYITCPEFLNSIAPGNSYIVEVEFYHEQIGNENIYPCFIKDSNSETLLTKLRVLNINVIF